MAVEISGKTGIIMPQGDTQVALFKYIPSGAALPAENIGPIWSDDYAATMVWTTVGGFTGYVSTNIGQVVYVESSTAPPGYVKSNGQTLSGAPYLQLIAFRGSAVLKDLRGEFIRSLDDGRAVDAGRALGSSQASSVGGHGHTVYTEYGATANASFSPGNGASYMQLAGTGAGTRTAVTSVILSTASTDTVVRNIALLACIKY